MSPRARRSKHKYLLLLASLASGLLWSTLTLPVRAQEADGPYSTASISKLHAGFLHPPDDTRIMMRWWWFGPSATNEEIQRELEQMKAAGIGGVEVATMYPLALSDPAARFHNYPYVSDEHIEHLRFAAEQARRLGLRMDVTLGSGWPFGGPHISATQAAGELRVEKVSPAPAAKSVAVPALEAGEKLIAAFLVSSESAETDMAGARSLPLPSGSRLNLPDEPGSSSVLFFISSRTGMMVKRAADGAAGFVLDHYDRDAIATHLHAVGDRLLLAFGDHPPYAVFSDSLEDYGSDWTPDLLVEFQRRRGYDLTPHLPALAGDAGPSTAAIRHDWGKTLSELADERFLMPIRAWAHQHHTLFRSQTYGFPPVTLSSNRYEDLPEGEGKATIRMWHDFSDTRWAASAGHLFRHNVISSETWTWLHSPSFRATPLDMKAEADLHFLQGINQLIGHGWPYSPPMAGEPGWHLYAAAAFNAHDPWFPVMPSLSAYLQRVSYALRLGKPANDVALLLPNDDVWASFAARIQKNRPATSLGGFDETGSNITIDESLPKFLGTDVIPQILDAGFNFDFLDADAINQLGIPYKVLILPGVDRIPVETYAKVLDFARHGGIVIATRRLPGTAPGYRNASEDTTRIGETSNQLFHGDVSTAHFVKDEQTLGASLRQWLPADFVTTSGVPEVGFIHRHLDTGDLYFVANTSNRAQRFEAAFRSAAKHAEVWDAFTGETVGIPDPHHVQLSLEPYESRLIFFSDTGLSPVRSEAPEQTNHIDLSHEWHVTFGENQSVDMQDLDSWADRSALRYYSGRAIYRKSVDIAPGDLQQHGSFVLDFGQGTPVPLPDPLPRFNMRAYLEGPVREAAEVSVNGKAAGVVWHPPFRVDVTPYLVPGKNEIVITVGNTAINEMAGFSTPNYRLLYDRYGVEFIPQDMQNLEPLPSGMLGPVTLIETRHAH